MDYRQGCVFDQSIVDTGFRLLVLRQREREVLLCVKVNQQNTLPKDGECVTDRRGRCCFSYASLVVGDSDYLGFHILLVLYYKVNKFF